MTPTARPPISADLLAQAASIEIGVCFGRQGDEVVIVHGVADWQIVTWRNSAAHDTAAQAAGGRTE
jgi:hypothetical protein